MVRTITAMLTGLAVGSTGSADDATLVKCVEDLSGKIERVDKKPTGSIIENELNRKSTDNTDVKLIAGMTVLQYLNLSKAKYTDDGLKEIKS